MSLLDFESLDFSPYEKQGLLLRGSLRGDRGFSCLHCWPDLGDPNIEDLKIGLRDVFKNHSLLRAAAKNLHLDLEARRNGLTIFSQENIESHFQIDIHNPPSLDALRQKGFKKIKIKLKGLNTQDLELLKDLQHKMGDLKLRLDFNASLNFLDLCRFLDSLAPDFLDCIDFIEDPFAISDDWRRIQEIYKVRLAADFEKNPQSAIEHLDAFDVLILKPARDDLDFWINFASKNMKRVVVTSYLQHPVGQAFDFYWAERLLICHPLLCDEFGFLANSMPRDEAGVGFSALLNGQAWQKLW